MEFSVEKKIFMKIDNDSKIRIQSNIFNFFKNFRDIYRLTVSAEDYINIQYLDRVANVMNFEDTKTETATEQLISRYQKFTEKVAETVESLVNDSSMPGQP